jgi:hypothetical protein
MDMFSIALLFGCYDQIENVIARLTSSPRTGLLFAYPCVPHHLQGTKNRQTALTLF